MAGEKTEKATPKKRGEARNKGRVVKSQELNSAVGLFAVFGVLIVGGPRMMGQLEQIVKQGLIQAGNPKLTSEGGMGSVATWALGSFAKAVAPVLIAAALAGILATVAQVRLRFNLAPMKPSFGKLNPGKGLKRLFGPNGLVETGKAIVKLTVIGGTAFLTIWPKLPNLATLTGIPPQAILAQIGNQVVSIVFRVGAMLLVLALIDWFWQRHRFEKSIKMTKDEIKQEGRQADLAPEVRGAIKRKQLQAARKRMLAAIPLADVIVVNPTHFAAALRYDGTQPAPELVAKGADHIAAVIREIAKEHGVPIVSNPPLARALYWEVELGQMIPDELFGAVAEVLAYVYRVAGRRFRPRPRRRALPAAAAPQSL